MLFGGVSRIIMVYLESCVDLLVISGLDFSYFFFGVIFIFKVSLLLSSYSELIYGFTLLIVGFFIFFILTFGLLNSLLRLLSDIIESSKVLIDYAILKLFELLRLLWGFGLWQWTSAQVSQFVINKLSLRFFFEDRLTSATWVFLW